MAFNIESFKSNGLVFGGARPSLFQVDLSFPSVATQGNPNVPQQATFVISAAQIPASTITAVEVPYFGRKIKINGDRTFADWTTTVMNDEDFNIRRSLENWMRGINSHVPNVMNPSFVPITGANTYKTTLSVTQFSKTGNKKLRIYQFVGAFPSNLSAIGLDWDATNRVETFEVTWSYDYWFVEGEDFKA
jgi:hypothetical protein